MDVGALRRVHHGTRNGRLPPASRRRLRPDAVNDASQRTDPDSLLNWFERLIRLRKAAPEIRWGEYQVVDVDNDAVLVVQYCWADRTTITVHNLAAKAATVFIPLGATTVTLRHRLGSSAPITVKDAAASVKIAAHGYLWFGVEPAPDGRSGDVR